MQRPSSAALLVLVLAPSVWGCAEPYRRGDLAGLVYAEHGGKLFATSATRRVGCLDVRVAAVRHPLVTAPSGFSASFSSAPKRHLFEFAFGNACDAPVRVDLSKVRVTAGPSSTPFVAFDPRREIHAGTLGPHREGREVIEFDLPASEPVESVCVDVTGIADGGEARQEVCFRRTNGEG